MNRRRVQHQPYCLNEIDVPLFDLIKFVLITIPLISKALFFHWIFPKTLPEVSINTVERRQRNSHDVFVMKRGCMEESKMLELRRSRFWNVYVCILWLPEGNFEGPLFSYMGQHSTPGQGVTSLEAV